MTNALPSSPAVLIRLSSEIVSSYVTRNAVPVAGVPTLIATVHAALGSLGRPVSAVAEAPAKPSLAEIRGSITPEALVSFLDGGRYRTLKRHLGRHGLTPAAYREQFCLPPDYPMVAAAYRAERSALAKAIGLGTLRKRQGSVELKVEPVATSVEMTASSAAPKRRSSAKAKPAEAIQA